MTATPTPTPAPTPTLLPFPRHYYIKIEVTRGCVEELVVRLPEDEHVYPWFAMAYDCRGEWVLGQAVERGANQVYLTLVEVTLAYLRGADESVFAVFTPAEYYQPYITVLEALR